jgi:hypothetical protein
VCLGSSTGYPETHDWYCDASFNNVLPSLPGSWVRCRLPWPTPLTPAGIPQRILLEDYATILSSKPGDFIFDNIGIVESDVSLGNCCEELDLNNYVDPLTMWTAPTED